MLKAILFDLDHTLYDRYATMEKTLPETYKVLSPYIRDGVPYEKFRNEMIFADKAFNYAGWGDRTEYLMEKGIFLPGTDARVVRLKTYETMQSIAVQFPRTREMLKSLRERGYKLAIVTNGEDYIQKSKIEACGFADLFDLVYICSVMGTIQKPEKEPFLRAAALLGVEASECVFVGDHPKNDILGARNAGMRTVWVSTCGAWRYEEYERADFEIGNVCELSDILPQIEKIMK